jgi:hypothetical protein
MAGMPNDTVTLLLFLMLTGIIVGVAYALAFRVLPHLLVGFA